MPARRVPSTVLRKTVDVALPLNGELDLEPATPPAEPKPPPTPTPKAKGGGKPDWPGDDWAGFDYWRNLWNPKADL